jgi:hypothetical protein
MAFVTRYRVEDIQGRILVEDFITETEAVRLANKTDGFVVEYRRPGFDFPRPVFHLQAAE